MPNRFFISAAALGLFLCGLMPAAHSQVPAPASSWQPESMMPLQQALDSAVQATLAQFKEKDLRPDQLAATVIDLHDPQHPAQASYRGGAQIYPASVIKLFYLAAVHRWLEDRKISDTPELRRAMRDMIVDSYNEATGYLVDVLTGTTSGPELPPAELEQWWDKRNAVNRYFQSLGYTNINVNKKPWCEGPYGREVQASQLYQPSRNWLTTDATARLMAEIATGRIVTAARCREMMELLRRDSAGRPAIPTIKPAPSPPAACRPELNFGPKPAGLMTPATTALMWNCPTAAAWCW